MYQCSKKLVTYKECCCFEHSDFPAHSLMYAEVAWVLLYWGTQIQLQVILDPDYLSVSYDYD